MWWEAIPCMVVIVGALTIEQSNSKYWHLLFFGNPYRRDLTLNFNRTMYMRDDRISGFPYATLGLESLSDEPEKV